MKKLVRKISYNIEKDIVIQEFLRENNYSNRIISQLKRELGTVCVNDIPRFLVDKVKKDDMLTVYLYEEIKNIPKYEKEVNIVYEDEDIAVINKSPDIAVIATKAHYGKSLMNALASVWGDFVYHPVNRLDYGTSGLMIVAKNNLAHSILSNDIKDDNEIVKNVEREYLAIVHNDKEILKGSGYIEEKICQPDLSNVKRWVGEDGQKAKTFYEVLKYNENYSLVRLKLFTGRTHQIRVHMAYINHALVGDELYGGSVENICRPCLHSYKISFYQPISRKKIVIENEMPSDMIKIMQIYDK